MIKLKCIKCDQEHELNVNEIQLQKIKNGAHIINVCPDLTVDERELMISRICGTCYDEMFKDLD